MKACIKCKKILPLTGEFFGIRKDSPDGYRNDCKACVKERKDLWYKANRQIQLGKMKKYLSENKETLTIKKKEHYEQNKQKINKKYRIYYKENRENILDRMKKHRAENRDTINKRRKVIRRSNIEKFSKVRNRYISKNRELIRRTAREYRAERIKNDINYKILANLRSRICAAIKITKSSKVTGTARLVGCTIPELKDHIERQFKDGMSWDNWAIDGWHIDHIIPCAKFDLSSPQQQQKCFSYKNLQPLWAKENLQKGARVSIEEIREMMI